MKDFGKKWFISASSGLLGRFLWCVLGVGGGILGTLYLLPNASIFIQKIVSFLPVLFCICLVCFFQPLDVFREWSREIRSDKIKELELQKAILELAREKVGGEPK